MEPHLHISALEGFTNALYVIIILGTIHITARHFEGHPFADMWLSVFA